MKILFYILAMLAGLFGLLALFRATESALAGNGIDTVQFIIGIVGIFLASLWIMRARSAK